MIVPRRPCYFSPQNRYDWNTNLNNRTVYSRCLGSMSATHIIIAHVTVVALAHSLNLFRRKRSSITREDAFRDVFDALGTLYESASQMKPEWSTEWGQRRQDSLPQKYDIGNGLAIDSAQDMRFAIRLLQRYRWKSVVSPLFEVVDDAAWSTFQNVAATISYTLASLSETHIERFYQDEQDWLVGAIEQFDEAKRHQSKSERDNLPVSQRVAEGVYEPVYAAIHLSDRLLERMRQEAAESQR